MTTSETAHTILNVDQLDKMYCSKCHKYLSVFPLKNYSNGETRCGRCIQDSDGGELSLHHPAIEESLFKCINHYDGCRKLLLPENVLNHERECKSLIFFCPKCKDVIERSSLDLVWHYKNEHPQSYLKKTSCEIKLQNNDVMLYIQNDVIFFIFYEYLSNSKSLCINAATLLETVATQKFAIIGSSGKVTNEKPCKSLESSSKDYFEVDLSDYLNDFVVIFFDLVVENELETSYKVPVINLKKDLKDDEDEGPGFIIVDKDTQLLTENGEKIQSTCSYCGSFMGNFIFRCFNKVHLLCLNCQELGFNICGDNSEVQQLLLAHPEKWIYPCKFNCGKFVIGDYLYDHQKICHLQTNQSDIQLRKEFFLCTGDTMLLTQQGDLINSKCSNCNHFNGTVRMFRCYNNIHVGCYDCSYCCVQCEPQCGSNCISFKHVYLDNAKIYLFPCNWKCGKVLRGMDVCKHLSQCRSNIQICPVCLHTMRTIRLKGHLKAHGYFCYKLSRSSIATSGSLSPFKLKDGFSYLLVNNNIIELRHENFGQHCEFKICNNDRSLKLFCVKCDQNQVYDVTNSAIDVSDTSKIRLCIKFPK